MSPPLWDPDDLGRLTGDDLGLGDGDAGTAGTGPGGRRPPRGLTRRRRRKLIVILLAAALGFSVPIWVPRLLATLPAFRITEVRVLGTKYARPEAIRRLADIAPDASVWDDQTPWEEGARGHPLVREATARRAGFHALEIAVVEREPVALIATPQLRPVCGDGFLLPLDPAQAQLDLPVIRGPIETEGAPATGQERVARGEVRDLIAALEQMGRTRREFLSLVSEIARAPEGGYRFLLLPGAEAEVVLLPREEPVRALDRVSVALGQVAGSRVSRADARFASQVVVTAGEGR